MSFEEFPCKIVGVGPASTDDSDKVQGGRQTSKPNRTVASMAISHRWFWALSGLQLAAAFSPISSYSSLSTMLSSKCASNHGSTRQVSFFESYLSIWSAHGLRVFLLSLRSRCDNFLKPSQTFQLPSLRKPFTQISMVATAGSSVTSENPFRPAQKPYSLPSSLRPEFSWMLPEDGMSFDARLEQYVAKGELQVRHPTE